MAGEVTELGGLLAQMQPVLHDAEYGYACVAAVPEGMQPFAVIREDEGVTLVALVRDLAGIPHQGGWARISLTVVSDLAAVGLTAAIAGALTKVGISANVVAGYHHDHFLVPADRAEEALAALRELAWISRVK